MQYGYAVNNVVLNNLLFMPLQTGYEFSNNKERGMP